MAIENLHTWKIGNVEITRIVEVNSWEDDITMLWPDGSPEDVQKYPWLKPHWATEDGKFILSFQCFVMRTPEHQIMLDTCIGADRQREFDIFTNMQTSFLEDMAQAGFNREEIDLVLCTHLHFDHVGWNTHLVDGEWVPTFPNARYLFGKSEYEHWKHLQDTNGYHDLNHMFDAVQPVIEAGLVDMIEPDHKPCPEITLKPTPGHTPGHVSICIESEGEKAIITGDMMHCPIQMAEPERIVRFDMDQTKGADTRKNFVSEYSDSGVLIIGSHFSHPTAGFVVSEADSKKFIASE